VWVKAGYGGRVILWAVVTAAAVAVLLFLSVRRPWLDLPAPAASSGLEPGYVYDGGPVVVFELKNFTILPRALVLVNHEPMAAFVRRYVTVPVAQGDLVQVDASFYSHPVVVEVLDVSRGVSEPEVGRTVEVDGTVATVGRVRLAPQT